MSALGRAFVMAFALMLATAGGLAFVVVASLSTGLGHGTLDAFAGFALFVWLLTLFDAQQGGEVLPILGALVALFLVLPMMMPSALMAILAEAFGWRSLTAHMAGNAAVAAVTGGVLGLAGALVEARAVPHGQTQAFAVLAATGAVIGLIYWALAGRKARGFLVRPPAPPAP